MPNNQERGPLMRWQLLVRGCKITKDRLIERVGGLPMVLADLLMEMVFKPLAEVHIK